MQKAVTITGLQIFSKKKYEALLEIEQFLHTQVGVGATVEDYFKIGQNDKHDSNAMPTVVVYFQTLQDKRDVLRFKSALRNRDSLYSKVYINDYKPSASLERHKRERQIVENNNKKENPLEIIYVRGAMRIQGEMYKAKVNPPTPKDIVDVDPDRISAILKCDLNCGGIVEQDKSIFQAYTAEVNTFQQIRDLYIKVRLMQPMARHIVCSYWIPGEEDHYNQNYCDDGEPGAGRMLLDFMKKSNLQCRVIFIARKYGGVKMGPSRFSCYIDAAEIVMKDYSFNKLLKQDQPLINAAENSSFEPKQPALEKPKQSLPPGSPKKTFISRTPPKEQRPRRGGARGLSVRGARAPTTQQPVQAGAFAYHQHSQRRPYQYGRGRARYNPRALPYDQNWHPYERDGGYYRSYGFQNDSGSEYGYERYDRRHAGYGSDYRSDKEDW